MMRLSSEIIIFICTVVGVIVAFLAYKSSTTDALKEIRKIASEKLEFLGRLNSELINDLNYYGEKNNAFESIFLQGLTLNQCLEILKKVQTNLITDENAFTLKKSNSKMRLDEITNSLNIQIKHHSEIRTAFDYYIKSEAAIV